MPLERFSNLCKLMSGSRLLFFTCNLNYWKGSRSFLKLTNQFSHLKGQRSLELIPYTIILILILEECSIICIKHSELCINMPIHILDDCIYRILLSPHSCILITKLIKFVQNTVICWFQSPNEEL